VQDRVLVFPGRLVLSPASTYFQALLSSDFKETYQDQIQLGDLDPDDFELMLEVIKESEMTAQFLLPEDLPFEMVLRLLVCAERFLVGFVKRLAEVWILESLGKKELRYYQSNHNQGQGVASDLEEAVAVALDLDLDRLPNGLKHGRDSSPSSDLLGMKRAKIDDNSAVTSSYSWPSTSKAVYDTKSISDMHMPELQQDVNAGEGGDSLQDCLLMVYETCSHPRFGSLYSSELPFLDYSGML